MVPTRPLMRLMAAALFAVTPATQAAVDFTDWQGTSIPALIDRAAENETTIMVVVTQPDWCPACIELERDILGNPKATDIADLTRDWIALEVFGYDEEGAAFLAEQGLKFVGTPTTLVIRPSRDDQRLGDGTLLTSIVGNPENFVQRLADGAAGTDMVRAAQEAAREDGTVEAFEALADAYVVHGDSTAAERVFRSLLLRDDLDDEKRADIRWALITNVYQRVEKDHERTLAELRRYAVDYPARVEEGAFLYASAWSLLSLGRIEDARAILKQHYLEADDPDRLASYLYMVFRAPTGELLSEAEAAARTGIERYPEQDARLTAGLARILRRRGCLEEAEAAFDEAVRLAGPEHDNYGIYIGQRDYVRGELAAGEGGECRRPAAGTPVAAR